MIYFIIYTFYGSYYKLLNQIIYNTREIMGFFTNEIIMKNKLTLTKFVKCLKSQMLKQISRSMDSSVFLKKNKSAK